MLARLTLEIVLRTTNGEMFSKRRLRAICRSLENEGFEIKIRKIKL